MEFKNGDVIICIREISRVHTTKYKLEVGKKYICVPSDTMLLYTMIKPHPEETYTISPDIFSSILYLKTRFIHENDWIGGLRCGI